jgi:hypothetical protein
VCNVAALLGRYATRSSPSLEGKIIVGRAVLSTLALSITWCYGYSLVIAFAYASTVRIPDWWRHVFDVRVAAFWLWHLPFDLLVTTAVCKRHSEAILTLTP